MNPIFSIGIESLWDEVSHMPTGGVWWMNTDRHEDAVSLLNQTLSAQADEAKVAVVSMGENPNDLIELEEKKGPKKYRFSPCRIALIVYTPCAAICSVRLSRIIILLSFYVPTMPGKIFPLKSYSIGLENPRNGRNTTIAPF